MMPGWQVYLTYLGDSRFVLAALTSFAVAVVAQAIGVAIGFLLTLAARSTVAPLRLAAALYIGLWRGTPPLVQLLLLYFGLPQLGIHINVIEAGLLGLGCYAGAYMAEIFRAGLAAVPAGEIEAARACGLSRARTMRLVILPQAMRVMLPPFGNEFASMLRTTSLLSVISFEELLRVTTLVINDIFRPIELYGVAATYYLAMTSVWMIIQAALERRFSAGVVARATPMTFAA